MREQFKKSMLVGLAVVLSFFTSNFMPVMTANAYSTTEPDNKVYVCKYVGTPGVNERLQTGDNPISVSINSLRNFTGLGSFFNDEQGRSIAIAYDNNDKIEPPVSMCPNTVSVMTAPYAISPTCEAAGSLVLPINTNIIWSGAVNGAGPGTYTVTASAAAGITLLGQSEWTVTVLPQLTGDSCGEVLGGVLSITPSQLCSEKDGMTGSITVSIAAEVGTPPVTISLSQGATVIDTEVATISASGAGSVTFTGLASGVYTVSTANKSEQITVTECAPQCIDADNATYSHTFNGAAGTMTVTLNGTKPLCEGEEQGFGLVSYTKDTTTADFPQTMFDSDTDTITSTDSSVTLNVEVPNCRTQVDGVWGTEIFPTLGTTEPRYGSRILGHDNAPGNRSLGVFAAYHGGRGTCTTPKTCTESFNGGVITQNTAGWSLVGNTEFVNNALSITSDNWVDGGITLTDTYPLSEVLDLDWDIDTTGVTGAYGVGILLETEDGDVIHYEPGVYTDDFWSNAAVLPANGGGQGGPYSGSLQDALDIIGDVDIVKTTFVFTSANLNEDVLLTSLSFNCTDYTFDKQTETTTTPAPVGVISKSDICALVNDTFTIPVTAGVNYYINGSAIPAAAGIHSTNSALSVTITASAQANYVLTGYPAGGWTLTFTNESCGEVDGITDVCPNITGTQSMIPVGYTKDSNGNCVTGGGLGGGQILGTTLPDRLPATGPVDSAINFVYAILAAIAAYGATYFLQGKRRFEQ